MGPAGIMGLPGLAGLKVQEAVFLFSSIFQTDLMLIRQV